MPNYYWIEAPLLAAAILGSTLAFVERIKSGRGLGLRSIQVLAVLNLIPAIVVLALEAKMSTEVGTIFGALAGFCLGGLRDADKDSK